MDCRFNNTITNINDCLKYLDLNNQSNFSNYKELISELFVCVNFESNKQIIFENKCIVLDKMSPDTLIRFKDIAKVFYSCVKLDLKEASKALNQVEIHFGDDLQFKKVISTNILLNEVFEEQSNSPENSLDKAENILVQEFKKIQQNFKDAKRNIEDKLLFPTFKMAAFGFSGISSISLTIACLFIPNILVLAPIALTFAIFSFYALFSEVNRVEEKIPLEMDSLENNFSDKMLEIHRKIELLKSHDFKDWIHENPKCGIDFADNIEKLNKIFNEYESSSNEFVEVVEEEDEYFDIVD